MNLYSHLIRVCDSEHEKQVVRPGHGLGFRGGIQLKSDLERAVNVLQL
jgi:hypothetical protein